MDPKLLEIAKTLLPAVKALDDEYYKTDSNPDQLIDAYNATVAETARANDVGEFDLHHAIAILEDGPDRKF